MGILDGKRIQMCIRDSTQIRGQITDGEVAHFQVGLKVGFRLEDA